MYAFTCPDRRRTTPDPDPARSIPPGGTCPNVCRVEYLRAYHTPAAVQPAGGARRTWTDEETLERLRPLTATRWYRLRTRQMGQVGAFPSYKTVQRPCSAQG